MPQSWKTIMYWRIEKKSNIFPLGMIKKKSYLPIIYHKYSYSNTVRKHWQSKVYFTLAVTYQESTRRHLQQTAFILKLIFINIAKTDRCACISTAILKLHRQFCSSGIMVHLKCLLEGHHKNEAFCHINDNLPKVTPSGNSSWRSKSSPKAYKNSKTIKASPKISGGSLVFTGIGTGSSYNPNAIC